MKYKQNVLFSILAIAFLASCGDPYDKRETQNQQIAVDNTSANNREQDQPLREQASQTQQIQREEQDTLTLEEEVLLHLQKNKSQAESPFSAKKYFTSPQVIMLAKAVVDGNIKSIEALVAKGADVNARGKKGITPLIYATLLMRRRQSYKDVTGREAPARECPKTQIDGVRKLLELGADPNMQTDDDQSAVSNAAYLREPDFLKVLLSHGGKPNFPKPASPATLKIINRYFWASPLYNAISGRSPRNVRLLIEAGANMNSSDYDGYTLLINAAMIHSYDALYELLEGGADFQAKNEYGYNVTHEILRAGNIRSDSPNAKPRQRCLDFLEKHGVDLEKAKDELKKLNAS